MKKYSFPLVIFVFTLGVGAISVKLLESQLNNELTRFLFKFSMGTLFVIYNIKFVREKNALFRFHKITTEQILLTLFLCLLFTTNNYFLATHSDTNNFMNNNNFKLVMATFFINSFYEEFAYRGFIQGYVNQNTNNITQPISQGNLFASCLMLLTHFGFFLVMDTLFAISGLILVIIFSLTVGYMRDKGANIWLLVLIHTMMNFIHVVLNLEHYY